MIFTLLFAALTSVHAETLSLNQYLDQVTKGSPGVKSSELLIQGSKDASLEGEMITLPDFVFQGSHDDRNQNNINYPSGVNNEVNIGVQETFGFGVSTKLTYDLLDSKNLLQGTIYGESDELNYNQGTWHLEATASLWRNLFGSETKANQTVVEASSLRDHYNEKFNLKKTIEGAEDAYHALAIAIEKVKLREEILDRSKKRLDWTTRRAKQHLNDRADLLQAENNYQQSQIDLLSDQQKMRTAKVIFNTQRYVEGDQVSDNVVLVNSNDVLGLALPEKAEVPDNIKGDEQNERFVRANNELFIQKMLPDLQFFGTFELNGTGLYRTEALSDSMSFINPYYRVGLKLTLPIAVGEASTIRAGRTKEQLSAEYATTQARISTDQTTGDLARQFDEIKARLKLADLHVKKEKEQMDYERFRLEMGRTTTFQTIQLEQDYINAQITRLDIEQELLKVYSQYKIYAKD